MQSPVSLQSPRVAVSLAVCRSAPKERTRRLVRFWLTCRANMGTKHRKAAASSPRGLRPLLRAAPFGSGNNKGITQILTEKQQAELASIATEVHFGPRDTVYTADSSAHSAFILKDGMVKAFRDLSGGSQRVLAFLFPGDVFGLAENGRYGNREKGPNRFLSSRGGSRHPSAAGVQHRESRATARPAPARHQRARVLRDSKSVPERRTKMQQHATR